MVLSRPALHRALLARQGLLEPHDLPLPRVLEQVGGIQAQYAPSMYVGLWSRAARFERQALTDALVARTVVQGTLLRSTIHLVSREDWWPFSLAIRASRQAWFLRVRKGVTAAELEEAAETVRQRVLAEGPLRQAAIGEAVGKERKEGVGSWVDLVRIPPSRTWEHRRGDLYELAERWIGPPPDAHGQRLLVERYLTAFGPAAPESIADWAGLSKALIAAALAELELVRFEAEDGAELVDLPHAPRPDPETPVPVRFLPTWDAALLVHARRTGILPEAFRPRVFSTKNPHSVCTFLVDGRVAGSWRFEDDRITLEPFAPLPAPVLRQVEEAAEPLAAFHR